VGRNQIGDLASVPNLGAGKALIKKRWGRRGTKKVAFGGKSVPIKQQGGKVHLR